MKILVCAKQVPDTEGLILNDVITGKKSPGSLERFALNRFDEFAVEAAVRMKESYPGVVAHVITVGPDRSLQVLKRAVGMGCDEGIHLETRTGDPGPAETAAWIAETVSSRDYGLILCGSMSEDRMGGQVGPMVAAHLDFVFATQVIAMDCIPEQERLRIEKEIEGGAREILEIDLPAVLALQPGINEPRYPTLSNMLRANEKRFEVISTDTLASSNTDPACVGMRLPTKKRPSVEITGTAPEKAAKLVDLFRARNLI